MEIKKILVANRGEIVLRVARAAEKMGIEIVSIYAENDRDLPHANLEHSISLDEGTLADTYLNQEKIIKIAKEEGCDAIHPGYGFLSENAGFCEAVSKEGIIFIGPRSESIQLMGDKIESKHTAQKFNLPCIPGYHGEDQSEATLSSEAKKMGFPILIKASAGGGGKGMRIVQNEDEFSESLSSVKREAKNAFGNDSVLIEKYIESPRHLEVQVLSDSHGNHYHVFERECSAQRRYQKIIEEAPAVNLKEETRKKLYEASTSLTSGINYLGAGTIEYIVDKDENIYFLEMNTRLQVEHCVSEQISDIDLVEWQIRIAQGEKLDFSQPTLPIGHSIECRIYAEDPFSEFLPTSGEISMIGETLFEETRFELSYMEGNVVGTNYDPMLGKLIVTGDSKEDCIEKMQQELGFIYFAGLQTNRDFLIYLLGRDEFKNSTLSTKEIEKRMSEYLEEMEEGVPEALALHFLAQVEESNEDLEWINPWKGGQWL